MSPSTGRDSLTPDRVRRLALIIAVVAVVTIGFVAPLLATGSSASIGDVPAKRTPVPPTPVPPPSATPPPASPTPAPTTPAPDPTDSTTPVETPAGSNPVESTPEPSTAPSYAGCGEKGPVRGAICNTIENAKRSILEGTLTATQQLARSTVELILRRPVPKQDGTIVVFRPPSNEPLAGAYTGWTSVGLPLGFLVWVIGVGVALASRFRPDASFATQGFQIEQRLARTLVLTIGSWWLGAFILHLANGLILAVAPRGDQLVMGAQSGVGSLLGTGLLAGLLWVATAAIVTILLVTTLLAYFLCLTFMVFLPVFSAFMLFDTGGVLQTIGQFGQTGWSIFIKAVFFPLPAALVLGAGTFIAGGTMGFVERAVAIGGFADIAGTLAFALVMFVTQLTALVATLWMLLGSRAAYTASGVVAGLGGAALVSRVKAKTGRLRTRLASSGRDAVDGSAGGVSGVSHTPCGINNGLGSPTSDASGHGDSGGTASASGGLAARGGTGRPRTGRAGSQHPSTGIPLGGSAPASQNVGQVDGRGHSGPDSEPRSAVGQVEEPIPVANQNDLPGGQKYQPGYLLDDEFQPAESSGQSREFLVREHDRFADVFDEDGDHPGIYLRGRANGRLYDASGVAGEEWGTGAPEAVAEGRDQVFDAREQGGASR